MTISTSQYRRKADKSRKEGKKEEDEGKVVELKKKTLCRCSMERDCLHVPLGNREYGLYLWSHFSFFVNAVVCRGLTLAAGVHSGTHSVCVCVC